MKKEGVLWLCRQLIHLFDPLEGGAEDWPVITLPFDTEIPALGPSDRSNSKGCNECVELLPVTGQMQIVSIPEEEMPGTADRAGQEPFFGELRVPMKLLRSEQSYSTYSANVTCEQHSAAQQFAS